MDNAIQLVLGAIIAILITIWVENLRKPRLVMKIAPPHDSEYEDRPAKKARFLSVEIENRNLYPLTRWMTRNAAVQCHGEISFHHLDGQNVFGRSMQIRWSGSIEPVTPKFVINENFRIAVIDQEKLALSTKKDIYPGESTRLDVSARFDNEPECYGWSNDNYFSEPIWRDPNWKLAPGRYLVKVIVTSSGDQCKGLFRLINDVQQKDFRLEESLHGDKVW